MNGALYNARKRRAQAARAAGAQLDPSFPRDFHYGRLVMAVPKRYREDEMRAETAAVLYIADMEKAIVACNEKIGTHVAMHRTLVDVLRELLAVGLTSDCRRRITVCIEALREIDPDTLARDMVAPPGLRVVASNEEGALPGVDIDPVHQLKSQPKFEACACFPGQCRGGEVIDGRLANGQRCKACITPPTLTVVSPRRSDTP